MIERHLYSDLENSLESDKINIVVGARQTGKTTLLEHLKQVLDNKDEINYLFTLEDKTILQKLNHHPSELFNIIPESSRKTTVLIDEIQYLDDPSNFLKYIYDLHKNKIKLVVTGSSAFYIDQKFKDSLAGRKIISRLYPFSFHEFLLAKGAANKFPAKRINLPDGKNSLPYLVKKELAPYLNEYFRYGGYPEVVLAETHKQKVDLLNELYQSLLKKDFLESQIKNEIKAYQLLRILAEQTGSLVNKNELSKTLGISIDAVENYLYILQKSLIIKICPPFYRNVRKELTKMPKVYFYDTGYRNAVLKSFDTPLDRIDKGPTLENCFFQCLLQLEVSDIQFWRTQNKNEVDFICDSQYAYELKTNPARYKESSYKKFKEAYPEVEFGLVTWESEEHLDLSDFIF